MHNTILQNVIILYITFFADCYETINGGKSTGRKVRPQSYTKSAKTLNEEWKEHSNQETIESSTCEDKVSQYQYKKMIILPK